MYIDVVTYVHTYIHTSICATQCNGRLPTENYISVLELGDTETNKGAEKNESNECLCCCSIINSSTSAESSLAVCSNAPLLGKRCFCLRGVTGGLEVSFSERDDEDPVYNVT